ncbi:hypothetical protein C1646_623700, partial [Rhizophagus diaphanus]
PIEFLNFLTIGGLSPHKLSLKIVYPVILLCNFNLSNNFCNRTRLICHFFHSKAYY